MAHKVSMREEAFRIPVLRPNEAMVEEALAYGNRIALMATFEPAIAPITDEIVDCAATIGRRVTIDSIFVPGAVKAAQEGNFNEQNELIAQAAPRAKEADVIGFAQFSMPQVGQNGHSCESSSTAAMPWSADLGLKAIPTDSCRFRLPAKRGPSRRRYKTAMRQYRLGILAPLLRNQ